MIPEQLQSTAAHVVLIVAGVVLALTILVTSIGWLTRRLTWAASAVPEAAATIRSAVEAVLTALRRDGSDKSPEAQLVPAPTWKRPDPLRPADRRLDGGETIALERVVHNGDDDPDGGAANPGT